MPSGTLYIVATPIGNLEDLTFRALRILREVDLVAAEDTRHSRKLFSHYGIGTPLTSFFQHNEAVKGERLLEDLRQGKSVALISDAGTPAIADPGFLLVRRCREEGIPVIAVPGPSAVVTALSIAGLPTDRFAFEGFLPAKTKGRRAALRRLRQEDRTTVFYEAPHRLPAALRDLAEELGEDREVAVARELTKIHEELYRGTASGALDHFGSGRVRGEIVLMVAPAVDAEFGGEKADAGSLEEALRKLSAEGMPPRQAVKQMAKEFGLPRDEVYRIWVATKDED
ncbi:16S rRNA (cytidine(1402)-2'-O)-methyltransferase [Desulfuromonas sp. TF]|uniref:16S rRNA (cytidine(1402)-2'-O)-methyltransferase n=1 Tax=Desulfuromonas sp. TF TaxID=1232410 RepID=UPI00041FF4E6|nr:16S rRNA (cytidine(1402)-2'-O)-methyltransferase [Desulfuromonas sp. TF]